MSEPTVVALGGGGFSMEPDNPLIDDHVLGLARASRGHDRPRVCFLPTASGDSPVYIATFYASYARKAEAAHLALFMRTVDDVEAFLLDQDVIYVGGGNTENMLAVWRVHGVDRALRRAWESGTVMTGLSAGSLCWFEPNRRPYYQRLVGEGRMPGGYAADDGAALVFRGTKLAEVVTSRPDAHGYRVERGASVAVVETVLPGRYLG